MDLAGNYVVTWSSFLQDGSGWGVYARRYSNSGATLGSEFRVSETALYSQHESAVSMDDDGNFVITWNSYNQEGDTTDSSGIFARMFNANGTDYLDPGTAQPLGEFRINAITEGEQTNPAVAMDADARLRRGLGWPRLLRNRHLPPHRGRQRQYLYRDCRGRRFGRLYRAIRGRGPA